MMRCVIALPDDGRAQAAPSALLAGFNRHRVAVSVVSGAPRVMLALAQQRATTVVVVDPPAFTGLDELVGAVRTYHPGVVCWEYVTEPGQAGRLRPMRSVGARSNEPSREGSQGPGILPGAGVIPGAGARVASGPPRRPPIAGDLPSPLVTREELAMLLGQHDPKQRGGGAAADSLKSPPRSAPEA